MEKPRLVDTVVSGIGAVLFTGGLIMSSHVTPPHDHRWFEAAPQDNQFVDGARALGGFALLYGIGGYGLTVFRRKQDEPAVSSIDLG